MQTPDHRNTPISKLLEELIQVTPKSGDLRLSKKKDLLYQLSTKTRFGSHQLLTYHDELLRLAAFSGDFEINSMAETEFTRLFLPPPRGLLETSLSIADSGVAGTELTASFSLSTTKWLLDRFGSDVDLDWHQIEFDSAFDGLREFLVGHITRDSVRAETDDLEQWCRWAAGPEQSPLKWITERLTKCHSEPDFADHLFDSLALPVRWRLTRSSRTFQRFPKRPLSHQRSKQRKTDFAEELSKPIPRPRRVGRTGRQGLIDLGRSILAVRHRETEALTYPNVNDVSLFGLEQGIDVALFGMHPLRRLPLESFFGFVAAKNRIPVAYGGGFVFFDRCDIGLNIFDTFRSHESTVIFSSILRAFVHNYQIKTVTVDSAQFGHGRPGGIKSGAFWFYYNLGFRPEDHDLSLLAQEESNKKKRRPSYRSSAAVLRKLTGSDLVMNLSTPVQPVPDLAHIGAYVLRNIGQRFAGDPQQAEAWAEHYLGRFFGRHWRKSATEEELVSYRRMAPLIASISNLKAWNKQDKNRLLEIMLAKGASKERDYVLKMQRHKKLRSALIEIGNTNG